MPSFNVKNEPVWTSEVHTVFMEALDAYPPRTKTRTGGESPKRLQLIAEFIERKTGKVLTPKQVSSHMNVSETKQDGIELPGLSFSRKRSISSRDDLTPTPSSVSLLIEKTNSYFEPRNRVNSLAKSAYIHDGLDDTSSSLVEEGAEDQAFSIPLSFSAPASSSEPTHPSGANPLEFLPSSAANDLNTSTRSRFASDPKLQFSSFAQYRDPQDRIHTPAQESQFTWSPPVTPAEQVLHTPYQPPSIPRQPRRMSRASDAAYTGRVRNSSFSARSTPESSPIERSALSEGSPSISFQSNHFEHAYTSTFPSPLRDLTSRLSLGGDRPFSHSRHSSPNFSDKDIRVNLARRLSYGHGHQSPSGGRSCENDSPLRLPSFAEESGLASPWYGYGSPRQNGSGSLGGWDSPSPGGWASAKVDADAACASV